MLQTAQTSHLLHATPENNKEDTIKMGDQDEDADCSKQNQRCHQPAKPPPADPELHYQRNNANDERISAIANQRDAADQKNVVNHRAMWVTRLTTRNRVAMIPC